MARLNIEDQFWTDVFEVIRRHPENPDMVIGNALRFFKYAQDQFKRGAKITEEDFKEHGFLPGLMPVFAKLTPDGIQAKGQAKHFSWLNQRAESGRKGGLASSHGRARDEKGHFTPRGVSQANAKQPKPSPSFSGSPYNKIKSYNDLDFQDMAMRIIHGTKKYGPDDSGQLREYLGDELWGLLQRSGGSSQVRLMRGDEHLQANIVRLLKGAKNAV